MIKVCVLGCGNMAQSLLTSVPGYSFFTYTPSQTRAIELGEKLQGKLIKDIKKLPISDVYLLACKPQQFHLLSLEIKNQIPEKALVISMLAGLSLESLKKELAHENIIRIMPNITAQVGLGSLLIFPKPSERQKKLMGFLEKNSEFFPVKTEEDFDKLMLITGSGPAYLFYFIRSFERYLQKEGLDHELFSLALEDTFLGAIKLMKESPDKSTTDWIEKVSSKGGVTEEALAYFDQKKVDEIIDKAMKAGVEKSKKLQIHT